MDTIALNNLWNYLQGLSLSAKNKRWLSDKLIESMPHSTHTAADDVLRHLDGCWAEDSDADMLEQSILGVREQNARDIEPFDE